MRSGKTLLFALAVLLLCSLFATMMSTHYVAEGFAPGDPTTISAERLAALNTIQQANSTALGLTAAQKAAQIATTAANIQALPPGMQPALSADLIVANNITSPIGTPLNPTNDQMKLVTEFYAKNPKKPPTPLSLRDQLQFNYDNLPPDIQLYFKKLGSGSDPTVSMGSVVPTTSFYRDSTPVVTDVPQTCAPYIQQTMEADANYFGAKVPAGLPQNAMSFPPASYSYMGPPQTTFIPGSDSYTAGPQIATPANYAYVGPPQTSFVPGSATYTPTQIPTPIPIPTPIQPAARKPPPLKLSQIRVGTGTAASPILTR
jgi:hypothetical protein